MYGFPSYLPPFSNREDFVLPLSIFDDDLNQPVNLAGITGSGTFSNWNVQAGVLTTSTTTITIPQYPVGNQLSSLNLTVAAGLTIPAGNPITISDAITGRNTMTGYVLNYVASTGVITAQIGSTFQGEVRRMQPFNFEQSNIGFIPSFDGSGILGDFGPILLVSLGNGILITDLGFIQIRIPESQFRRLRPNTYNLGLTFTDSQDTRQILISDIPVLYGGVTQ